jgi:thiol-disulfide isomerase/thioredoxin
MKASTILLILMFLVTFVPFNIGGDDVSAYEYDHLSNEGYVAHVVNESNWDSVPDDQTNGPHEDLDKCVCKGTGTITHGDGHQTPCPFHGGTDDNDNTPTPNPRPNTVSCKCDTGSTYCNCVAAYGECRCEKYSATLGSTKPIGKSPVSQPLEKSVDETESFNKHSYSTVAPESFDSNVYTTERYVQEFNRLPKINTNPIIITTPEPFNGMVSSFAAEHFTKDRQAVVFTAKWCGPCVMWNSNEKPKLIDLNWIVSKDKNAHIRLIDIDANEENAMLYERYGEGFVPSFHLFLKGEKIPPVDPNRPAVGYHTAKEVTDLYYAEGGKDSESSKAI